jgi:excisionase family DNA binding protein
MPLQTIREFRKEVQASDPTVRRWIRDGVIPIYRVRHFIRIDRDAALEALKNFKRPKRRKNKELVNAQ